MSKPHDSLSPQPGTELAFTPEQLEHMKRYQRERSLLEKPTMLVVEDQEFSRKLLEGMLRRNYNCNAVEGAQEAIAAYGEFMPSIVFLDIELPDGSGHEIAALIKKHDPESFVVMVSANHSEKDVKIAMHNKVDGFIAKPYSRSKIEAMIEKYKLHRSKRAPG